MVYNVVNMAAQPSMEHTTLHWLSIQCIIEISGCKRCNVSLKHSFEIFQYFMVKVSLFHETLGEEGETSIYAGAQKSDQVRQWDYKMSLKYLFKLYIVWIFPLFCLKLWHISWDPQCFMKLYIRSKFHEIL